MKENEQTITEIELTPAEHEMVLKTHGFAQDFIERAKIKGESMGGHALDHALRVAGNATQIARGERTRVFPVLVTALLIDLGRHTSDERSRNYKHGEVSMEISQSFLKSLDLPEEEREDILLSIRDHSKLNEYVENPTETIKIVMDADRLATLGALSPLRAAATNHHLPLIRLDEKFGSSEDGKLESVFQDVALRHVEWFDMIWTNTGKRMAQKAKAFHDAYIERLRNDVEPAHAAIRDLDLPLSKE